MNIHSVTDLTRYVKNMIERDGVLRNIAVRGEISNFKRYASGHCYFTLKDSASALKCVMFKAAADKLAFMPKDGMALVAIGRIAVYERDGVYQLYVEQLEVEGVGALHAKLEELKNKLYAEGLFDEAHKKRLPKFVKTIGVVTSETGAVIRDILRVSKRRNKNTQIILYPSLVQGEGAAENIAEGIKFFNKKYPVDVLIVGRGGGSIEDLWAFNEETVVRAIYESKIPVISAVGHEVDVTLSDFVADKRAATPSQAAEIAVCDAAEVCRYIENLMTRLKNSAMNSIKQKEAKLQRLKNSAVFTRPKEMLLSREQRLDAALERLNRVAKAKLEEKERKCALQLEKLDMLNPARVLMRGYSMTELKGKTVRRAKDLAMGDNIRLIFVDGEAGAKILKIGS